MPFAGLGRSIGGLVIANVVVKTIRRTMPKKSRPKKLSYLQTVSIQSRKMRSGQISIKKFKKNMDLFRKQSR